jgi:Zn-dependent protease with chaperone function
MSALYRRRQTGRAESGRGGEGRLTILARFILVGLALGLWGIAAAPVRQAYVDRRVSALPAAVLLQAAPQALIDPRRQKIAETLGVYRRVLFLASALSQILVFYYLWRSGNAARLRDALKRRLKSLVALRFAYGFSLAAIAGIAALPASAAQYRVSVVFDQSTQPFWGWLLDGIVRVTIDGIAVGLLLVLIMAMVQRTRAWWIYSIVAIFLVSALYGLAGTSIISPLFNHYRPIGDRRMQARFVAFEREANVDTPIVWSDASRQTQLAFAEVLGFGPGMRIVVADNLLNSATRGEVEFAVARQIAHVVRNDSLRTAFVWTFLFVLSIAAGVLVADRIGYRRDDDPLARLALVGALAGLAGLVAFPLYNLYSRHIEVKADAYALQLTHDPASAVRSFVRSADRRFVALCTPRWANIYFGPAKQLGTRIAIATHRHDPCR